jgi:hypothetical protein
MILTFLTGKGLPFTVYIIISHIRIIFATNGKRNIFNSKH